MPIDPQQLYVQLGRLVEAMPNLEHGPISTPVLQWLSRAHALVFATGSADDVFKLKTATDELQHTALPSADAYDQAVRRTAARNVATIVYRALAIAELNAPAAAQGSFIPAGNAFDAFAAMTKVLTTATRDVLIVDPYMDEKTLTEFVPLVPERVFTRLLADEKGHKATLVPAAKAWVTQHGSTRPLEVRLTAPRALHDRLIIMDGATVWVLTQSLNAFAARAPASIVRVNDDTAGLKVAAYQGIWNSAATLI